jgi:hypothetical protein
MNALKPFGMALTDPAYLFAAVRPGSGQRKRAAGRRRRFAFSRSKQVSGIFTMSNAAMLRERADRCREIAKDYHPSVGQPLLEKATELDRQASEIERNGRERRAEGGFILTPPAPRFGKRGA